MKGKKISLRAGFLGIIVSCWLIPIMMVTTLATILLGMSYEQSAEQELNSSAEYAIRQVQVQLDEAIRDSKDVSYAGTIRSAYREYQENGNGVVLFRTIYDYMNQNFSRSQNYQAVFVNFWDDGIESDVCLTNSGTNGYDLVLECDRVSPEILSQMQSADTGIRFLAIDGRLYLARNLLDSKFDPYASVVLMLDPQAIFSPLNGLHRVEYSQLRVDDLDFCLDEDGNLISTDGITPEQCDSSFTAEVDGHRFTFSANLTQYDLWTEDPWIVWLVSGVSLMLLPMILVVVSLFRYHVTKPTEVLAQANQLVQSGKRGYEITDQSPNAEFDKLFQHFNAMSIEMKNQFEHSYLEQQALQKAQIKALQSQINPHFLNNTLEIINWEARIADNTRVSAMIEALSTMLGAALDRKGRTQIPLKEELGYVDAYLYIIQERIGAGFHVFKEILPATMPVLVPRLILQPIVENAVEHDISANHGGNLWLRSYEQGDMMVLEVEHDGVLLESDKENIKSLLGQNEPGSHVGIRNVNQRLRLIYGSKAALNIFQSDHDTIISRITFPIGSEKNTERNPE